MTRTKSRRGSVVDETSLEQHSRQPRFGLGSGGRRGDRGSANPHPPSCAYRHRRPRPDAARRGRCSSQLTQVSQHPVTGHQGAGSLDAERQVLGRQRRRPTRKSRRSSVPVSPSITESGKSSPETNSVHGRSGRSSAAPPPSLARDRLAMTSTGPSMSGTCQGLQGLLPVVGVPLDAALIEDCVLAPDDCGHRAAPFPPASVSACGAPMREPRHRGVLLPRWQPRRSSTELPVAAWGDTRRLPGHAVRDSCAIGGSSPRRGRCGSCFL